MVDCSWERGRGGVSTATSCWGWFVDIWGGGRREGSVVSSWWGEGGMEVEGRKKEGREEGERGWCLCMFSLPLCVY